MSAKWRRSLAWDDLHFPAAMWPVKAVLRALSSIWLAVVLLSLIALYATMASVPLGLLALAPTFLVKGLTLVATVGVVGCLPAYLVWRGLRRAGRGARFAASFVCLLVLSGLAVAGWWAGALPALSYDPATGTGFRLFASFVEEYKATTIRRLPGVEMSELEFYSWWPLRVVLLVFVANMVVATVRRIEFTFPNIGVLTVHTGIVVIAMGSIYYTGGKLEGDMILRAGMQPGSAGEPSDRFYDNTRVALHVSQSSAWWEQRPLTGVPRYNDYNLGAGGEVTARGRIDPDPDRPTGHGALSLEVARPGASRIDADLTFRVVGYSAYAEPVQDWAKAAPPAGPANPLQFMRLTLAPMDQGLRGRDFLFYFLPKAPQHRVADTGDFGIEVVEGMSEERFADLTAELPSGASHALVIEVPGSGEGRVVVPAEVGQEIQVGATGYRVTVERLEPRPPFPIITDGYRDATSSVAIVRVTPPSGPAFSRWVYHRFPEISQDMLDEVNAQGMPTRRAADPAIRIGYVDASRVFQVYVDAGLDGRARAIIRKADGVRVVNDLGPGSSLGEVVERVTLSMEDRWDHAEALERPRAVPAEMQEKASIGTHDRAMLGVEVSMRHPQTGAAVWSRVVWLPFTRYLNEGMGTERRVTLPDGRSLEMAFGRVWHALPGFSMRLLDFEMIPYPHGDVPRDYRSTIRVERRDGTGFTHVARLNAPLTAPFLWSPERGLVGNIVGRLVSALSPAQFKFSQAGWDASGWRETSELARQGRAPRASVRYTILGVGNNPGIHVIALGGVLMSVGIPWAFYIKPMIMRARKRKIQRDLARGVGPSRARAPGGPPVEQAPNMEVADATRDG